jgi:hypothetical protein
MIRLHINPTFEPLLQANNLSSYSQIMQTSSGIIIEEECSRDVRSLDLDGQKLYLKRCRREKLSSALQSYCLGKLAHSKPYKEMLQFRYLSQRHFAVAEVVAVGEELNYGIPLSGFIMTREVPGQDLALVYRAADKDTRHCIMSDYGSLLGRLHNCGFYGSLRLKDIFIDGDPCKSPTLTQIDRETRRPYPRPVRENRVLTRLLLNVSRQTKQGEIFSTSEWESFADNYCRSLDEHLSIDAKALLIAILVKLDQPGKAYLPE